MLHLDHPPIIEAVVEINCDMPPSLNLSALEVAAKQAFRDGYPKARRQVVQSHDVRFEQEKPAELSSRQHVGALQFYTADEKQLVQVRPEGYSFNRLAPYTTMDEYLPEIECTWNVFRDLTHPLQIRGVAMRYINRLILPTDDKRRVELNDYLRVCPHLPDEESLMFVGFFNQHSAVELSSGNQVNITLASRPIEEEAAPFILDIEALNSVPHAIDDWLSVRETINSLRRLKNDVFEKTLTQRCLNLYRAQ